MKTFATNSCPLCGKRLVQKADVTAGQAVLYCLTQVSVTVKGEWTDSDGYVRITESKRSDSHYSVAYKKYSYQDKITEAVQHTIVPPYMMRTVAGTGRTQIIDWRTGKFILEIPLLLPDRSEEKLAFKLKTYVLFS